MQLSRLCADSCVCVCPVNILQVKKRGRWLHRFSLDVLSKLPGTADDPFEGVSVDTNSLGACAVRAVDAAAGLWQGLKHCRCYAWLD